MGVFGFILVAIALILFFIKQAQVKSHGSLLSARLTNIQELQSTCEAITQEIGGRNWRDYVKLWGKIRVDEPLMSEIRQEPCVYYRILVQREYEEKVRSQDSEGKTTEKIVRKSETITQNQRSTPFILEDKTGAITINPQDAKFDTIKTLDEFRTEQPAGGMLQFGNFSFLLRNDGYNTHTLGYRYQEFILPINREVLVLGNASDETGELRITKPTDNQPFLVSLKTEEELKSDYLNNQNALKYGMIGCLFLGVILILIDLVS
ncbi:MAG: E3 ubiquitin ligase family protein [Cyanobacterium sp.]